MLDNSNQNLNYEISILGLVRLILESKKLIISTILIFTTASIIYSLSLRPSFTSSIQMEIGYFEMADGTQKLIEMPSDLISDLRLLKLRNPDNKFSQDVSMNSIEGRVIKLETNSSSIKQNENLLTEIISYIDERHSNFVLLSTNLKKDRLSRKIELIESEISFIKEEMQLALEGKVLKLETILPILNQEISQLEQAVIDDTNNLNLLKGTTLSIQRASSSPTLEQIISGYKSQINQFKRERNANIIEVSILSQKLDNLKKDTLQSDELFKLENSLKITENELQMLMIQTQVKTQPIGNIETKTIEPKTQLIISLSILMGFFTGILLIFIKDFTKSYRES